MGVLRSVMTVSGGQCVMMHGALWMLQSPADSLGSSEEVSDDNSLSCGK